jgi:hypothetical protein
LSAQGHHKSSICKLTSIETDTVTTSRSVNLNLSGIWCEALCWIFCSDTALEGKAACGDVVLGQTELLKRCTSSNLDLCGNDVDTSDFLSDGVLDLDTRVDFDEVIPILL